MNKTIWLINPYGPIPGEGWREYRFSLIARTLAADGYSVIWWTSSFSHHFKHIRCKTWEDRNVAGGYTLRLVPTPAYRRNIGLGRVLRDWVFALKVYRRGRTFRSPDLVIFAESPLCLGFAGYRLARHFRCKMIVDQMDLWPEIFEAALKPTARNLLAPLFCILYWQRRLIYRQLDASIALATPNLEAMHRDAPVLKSRPHAVVYNGIDVTEFRYLMKAGGASGMDMVKRSGEIWAVFAGSLGETYDIRVILQAAKQLEQCRSSVKLILAGDGPLRQEVFDTAKKWANGRLRYCGKLFPQHLPPLYKECDIGLCAYSPRSNVEMPDKLYDYTAAGLAVVNSLRGEVSRKLSAHAIGLNYQAGDANDLTRKLLKLEEDSEQLSIMRRNSFALGESFDSSRQLAKVTEIVRMLFDA